MRRRLAIPCTLLALALAGATHGTGPGLAGQDHRLFTRMPDFDIDDHEVREFDAYEFKDPDGGTIRVEGRRTYLDYGLLRGADPPSELQILRNHTNAIREIGGTVLWQDDYNAHMKVSREGRETWAHVRVYNQATSYALQIVEKEAMTQEVVADAESMARDIGDRGKVALYGIYFDFDKAVIKPESEPTLREIARLLSADSQLRLHVVGHSDGVGSLDYNIDLSSRRAAAVVAALVSEHDVDAGRLRPAGVGSLAPVASNSTEEGRARNRRVELVEQ